MELVGIIACTIVMAIVAFGLFGMGWLGIGVGGPSTANVVGFVIFTTLSIGVGFLWWVLVGTHIHMSVSFG